MTDQVWRDAAELLQRRLTHVAEGAPPLVNTRTGHKPTEAGRLDEARLRDLSDVASPETLRQAQRAGDLLEKALGAVDDVVARTQADLKDRPLIMRQAGLLLGLVQEQGLEKLTEGAEFFGETYGFRLRVP